MLKTAVFYILAVLLIVLAGLTVTLRNIFHAALALAAAFLCTAGLFILLSAEFLAGVQVLIYVGAVTVLIIFGIFLTRRLGDDTAQHVNLRLKWPAALVTGTLLALLIAVLTRTSWTSAEAPFRDFLPRLGHLLLGVFVLPFEVVSVLLLAALVGAIAIARRIRP